MSRASNGAVVFDCLQKAKEPLTAAEIETATGLSYYQVQSGLGHIREVLGPIHAEPLINRAWSVYRKASKTWAQWTYELSDDAKAVRDYGAYRLRVHTKQLRNLALVLEAGATKTGDPALGVLKHSVEQAAATAEFVEKQLLGAP